MAVAKASFGKGFSTVINYVMTQKDVPLALQPVLLECNNLRQGDPKFMARQMLEISKDHATTRPVMHVPISFNSNEKITDEQAEKAINSILSDIGVDREKHQFIIVEHFDKPNTRHFHCVVNRVDLDAKLLPDTKIVYKLQVACDKAEVLQGLERTPNRTVKYDPSSELGYRYATKEEKREIIKNRLKEGKKPQIGDDKRPQEKLALEEIEAKIAYVLESKKIFAKTPEEFKEKLAENGIEVRFSYDKKNDNAIRGASFKSDKITVKGGEIGVKWDYINAYLEHNKAQYYNYEIEQPVKMNKVQAMHGTKTTDVAHTSPSAQQYLKEEQKAKELSSTLIAGAAQSAQVQTATENLAEKELGETIAQIGKEVLQTAKTLEEFKYKLAKKGITVDFTLQAKGISGVKFTQNGISFKGSEIGLKVKEIEEKIKTNLDQEIAPSATPTPTPAEQEKAKDLIAREKWLKKYFEFNNEPESKGLATSLAVEETFKLALEMKASMPKLGYNDMQIADQAIRLSMRNYEYFTLDDGKPVKESNPWGGWDILVGKEKYIELLQQVEKQKQGEIPTLDNSLDLRSKYDVIHLIPRFKKETVEKTAKERKKEEKRARKEEKKEEKQQKGGPKVR